MRKQCLHELFIEQAKTTPDEIAVVDGQRAVTYRELDDLSNRLAGYLQKWGVMVEDCVGILLDKSLEYIITYIAILKAGAAYMPMELANPDEMIGKMIKVTKPKMVVTRACYGHRVAEATCVLPIDNVELWQCCSYDASAVVAVAENNLAYIVFSSGTTGEPKGILAPHKGAVYSYFSRYEISSYRPKDRVACNVFFVWELLRPLLKGATCYVIPEDEIYDPRCLTHFLATNQISEVLFTPSLLENILNAIEPQILREKLASLRVVWLNGEVVSAELRSRALQALPEYTRLLNTYSISECHDVASLDLRELADPDEICPVGRPVPGVRVKLLDSEGKALLPGEVGELYIGGPCLARGYLNNPTLTSQRFVFLDKERYYRTGDLARILSDGNLEIRGRCDSMVKIRGYSVELGAVETNLMRYGGAQSCVVVVEGKEGSEKRLVAYIVKDERSDWDINPQTGICVEIREKLSSHLPHYMIPSVYVEMDSIPINAATGKANKKLLPPAPRSEKNDFTDIRMTKNASIDEQEKVMSKLWESLLALEKDRVNRDSDFFDCGGHSLLAADLSIAVEKIFDKQILVKDIYENSTVGRLTNFLNGTEQVMPCSFKEDIALDKAIVPSNDIAPLVLGEAETIFLTGATGFLGAFLLDEIFRATANDVKIHCLVRTRQGVSAQRRLVDNLQRYGLWRPEMERRVVSVMGDLGQPHLGLSDQNFEKYAKITDMIFHCGALVNYVYSYDVLKPATVNGTEEILRLACAVRTTPVHYISTNGIFGGHAVGEPYPETSDIDAYAEHLPGGYCSAKWVAEKMVWQAVERGLPACLYRPGNIGHHSETGVPNFNDFQYMILQACKKICCAPDVSNWAFEMTPVDFLVRAIVSFASSPAHYGKVYNSVERFPTSANLVFDLMKEMRYISRRVPLAQWTSVLYEKSGQEGESLLHILAQSLNDVLPYLEDKSLYHCKNFHRSAAAYNVKLPKTGADYFRKLLVFLAG